LLTPPSTLLGSSKHLIFNQHFRLNKIKTINK
jgi:hypothetical protein